MPGKLRRIAAKDARLGGDVYERLLDAIADGVLVPGDRLIQDRLAEQLGVSRTPVREALLRMEREGLIVAAPKRGYVIPHLDPTEIDYLYEAREAVEGFAAAVVAARADAEALTAVRARIEALDRRPPRTVDESFRANRDVHRAIVAASGNPVLVELFDAIWSRQSAFRTYARYYELGHRRTNMAAEHSGIFTALEAGDPERARAETVAHIHEARVAQVEHEGGRSATGTGRGAAASELQGT